MLQGRKRIIAIIIGIGIPVLALCVYLRFFVLHSGVGRAPLQSVGTAPASQEAKRTENVFSSERPNVSIPLSGREIAGLQMLEKGLPIASPIYLASQKQLEQKTVEQLVSEMGSTWQATTMTGGSDLNRNDFKSLFKSFSQNLMLLKLIEEGRKSPDVVGSLIANDLMSRIENFPNRFKQLYEDEVAHPGNIAFAVSEDGKTVGNDNYRHFEEDRYAIQGGLWVLVNINYAKGIETVRKLAALSEHPDRHAFAKVDMVANYFAPELPIYVYYELAREEPSLSRSAVKQRLDSEFAGMAISKMEIVKSPSAMFPQTDPIREFADINQSSEPRLTIKLPATAVISPSYNTPNSWFKPKSAKFELWKVLATDN